MDFTIYDITLLVIFVVCTSIFLYARRKNLKKEGLLFLYRTSFGVRIINKIGNKYKKLLNALSYISITLGFLLMGIVLYLSYTIVRIYLFRPDISQQIKIPPIMPLVPYIDKLVPNLNLPNFYFIYWIIIIAIVAISHEFAHGIFAANKKIKIKSTGFGFFPFFLPIFLAAFVELDEKRMEKKKILPQMAVLSAGTFANTLTAIFFSVVLLIFFSLVFIPSGVVFDVYPYSNVNISAISSVNGISIEDTSYEKIVNSMNETGFNEITTGSTKYIITKNDFENQKDNLGIFLLYDDAPAVKVNLTNTIVKINRIDVSNKEKLGEELLKYSPGDRVIITTLYEDTFIDYEIILGEHPEDKSIPYLGIGFISKQSSGFLGRVANTFSSFKDSNVYYKPNFEAAEFIYNLLWWLVLISFSVALINMLPVGIFDGGRFFYLTILGVTKSKEKAKKTFSIVTYLFLFLLLVIMIFWAISFFR